MSEELESPAHATVEELKELNAKIERLIGVMQSLQGHIVKVEMNTRRPALR